MAKTITKTEDNHVIIEETVKIPDRVETEEFDQGSLDYKKVKAQEALIQAQARITELDDVQTEMDKQI